MPWQIFPGRAPVIRAVPRSWDQKNGDLEGLQASRQRVSGAGLPPGTAWGLGAPSKNNFMYLELGFWDQDLVCFVQQIYKFV